MPLFFLYPLLDFQTRLHSCKLPGNVFVVPFTADGKGEALRTPTASLAGKKKNIDEQQQQQLHTRKRKETRKVARKAQEKERLEKSKLRQ